MTVATVLCVLALNVSAQPIHGRLPLESYSGAQGLANDSITAMLSDSRGFLWLATLDGLSRFDGDRFVNYTTKDGLPHRMIMSVAEDRQGTIWVGTQKGAARMTRTATRGRALFETIPWRKGETIDAAVVFVDSKGTVWAECGQDLCTIQNSRFVIDTAFTRAGGRTPLVMRETDDGDLLIGSEQGLLIRHANGSWEHIAVQPRFGEDFVSGILRDPDGRVWISNGYGLIIWGAGVPPAGPLIEIAGKPLMPGMPLRLPNRGEAVAITIPHHTLNIRCQTPHRARDGSVWQPCVNGLLHIGNGRIDLYDENDGLPPLEMVTVGEDPAGDIWIGTRGGGAYRVARSGAMSYTRAHGLAHSRIMSVFSLPDGSVCVTNPKGLTCFRGDEMHHGNLWPRGTQIRGWGWNQIVVQDPDGSWWFPTGEGLVHWARVARIEDFERVEPLEVYTAGDGKGAADIFRVWRDSAGTLWVGTFADRPLSIFDRDARRLVSYGEESGFPKRAPTAFAEDRAGNVWIATYGDGVVRAVGKKPPHFEWIRKGIPTGLVRDLKIDSEGGLWIGSTDGVARIKDPTRPAAQLEIEYFSEETGLASNSGYCFVEMPGRRMGIGSQRGFDILDRNTGRVTHLTMRDGLASNEVVVAMLDGTGALWLGTMHGLSRLPAIPKHEPATPPRQPRIHTIAIDSVAMPVPELGITQFDGVRIEYPQHSMVIGFSSSDFDVVNRTRFEYRLGSNSEWTNLGQQRAIAFDHLRAGRGTLEIRAVAEDRASPPASVSFEVVPAIWNRTWFLALVAALVAALVFALHRYRVAHLIALERVRTRVATDLHDDLGSSLSRISILSEAAKRRAGNDHQEPILDEIADSARGLVDALGDSIWSIDPTRDDVRNLLLRVRNFADAIFEAKSVAIDVRIPPEAASIHLGPEERREVYLILKEALNNTAKHAEAKHVAIDVTRDSGSLRFVVTDDGRGFRRENGGRGVPSMKDRARRVGGVLEIQSEPGTGTSVTIEVPV